MTFSNIKRQHIERKTRLRQAFLARNSAMHQTLLVLQSISQCINQRCSKRPECDRAYNTLNGVIRAIAFRSLTADVKLLQRQDVKLLQRHRHSAAQERLRNTSDVTRLFHAPCHVQSVRGYLYTKFGSDYRACKINTALVMYVTRPFQQPKTEKRCSHHPTTRISPFYTQNERRHVIEVALLRCSALNSVQIFHRLQITFCRDIPDPAIENKKLHVHQEENQ